MRNHVRTILVSLSAVLVIVAGTVVGTNLVTAIPVPVTVTFNYNGATGGNTATSAIVNTGDSANAVLPLPTKPGESFTGWFNTQSLLNGQRITTIGESDAGELIAGYVPPELAQTLNLVLPPPPPATCANGLVTCVIGNIGPGGGLVFLISGGKTYEMAPNTWSGSSSDDSPTLPWCNVDTDVTGALGTAIGEGAANTIAMDAVCTSGAGQEAADYTGGAKTDWFLPSQGELNAMNGYKNSIVDTAKYGFASASYWSSSQDNTNVARARTQTFASASQGAATKSTSLRVRPVRAF